MRKVLLTAFYIFGEKAYKIRLRIQRPYFIVHPGKIEAIFDTKYSSVRVVI